MNRIRVGICCLVSFAVLVHGAVEVWSATLLEIGAAALFVLWGMEVVRRKELELRWNSLYVPLFVLGGLALAQKLFALSVYPYATKIELLKAASYLMVLFLTVQSFRSAKEWKGFTWFLVSLGAIVSLLAIVQYFTFNGKLYWFRALPEGVVPFGPFVNHNHFAGFVELVIPLGFAMALMEAVRRDKLPLLIMLTALPVGALALSGSRGGIVSLLFEFIVLIFLAPQKGERKKQLSITAGFAVVAALLAIWLGLGPTTERFAILAHGDISRDRRISMYRDTWRIVADHPWTGTGLGTLQTTFPRYESYYDGRLVDHAHNDYLEMTADTGLLGLMSMLGFIIVVAWRGLTNLRAARDRKRQALYCGSLTACAGLLLHSLLDFNLHIPSNALLFLLLAAMATSTMTGEPQDNRSLTKEITGA